MPDFTSEIQKQSSGESLLDCIIINHSSLPETLYLVINNEEITHDGTVYKPCVGRFKEPDQSEKVPTAEITVGNVDLEMMDIMQLVEDEPEAECFQVFASDPNVVATHLGKFKIKGGSGNYQAVNFELSFSGLSNKPFPKDKFDSRNFKGLYK